ncbi:alpha-endosulfine-like [Vidua macroura]|uniref:alpha-endosulfine-like n=1 Tax=Vidua macroura TaxID=187451 RepID=UPI0023A87724|nr:alpha-endosulfine-like [Vidua macroura]
MSLRPLLCVHWVELLSVTQLRQWRRWRPFWSRARGRTQRRERGAPLAAMAAPLGTGAFTEETGREKQAAAELGAVSPARAELEAKYPGLGLRPGGAQFLLRRLHKGQKYFDSGDYNMAKAKMKNKQLPSAGPDKNLVTGDHIPTPQDLPQRKSSLVTSKLAG